MHRLALIVIAGTAACGARTTRTAPSPDDALGALVGVEHPPRHANVAERSSFLLDESERGRWVVAEVIVAPDRTRGVLLDEVIAPGTPRQVRYRTVAVQPIAPSDSLLPIYLGTCSLAGAGDRTIIAVGAADGGPIRHAWRADTAARKFARIKHERVTCTEL